MHIFITKRLVIITLLLTLAFELNLYIKELKIW